MLASIMRLSPPPHKPSNEPAKGKKQCQNRALAEFPDCILTIAHCDRYHGLLPAFLQQFSLRVRVLEGFALPFHSFVGDI